VLLSVLKVREKVVEAIPKVLKVGTSAGVGIFLIRLSLVNANLVAPNFGGLGDLSDPTVLLAAIGMGITLLLHFIRFEIKGRVYQIRGDYLISIILITIIGVCMGVVQLPANPFTSDGGALADVTGKLNFLGAFKIEYFSWILVFFMGDFFSTLGTALGCASKAGMLDENGNLPTIGKVFLVDSVGTCVGAFFGLTTVTTYVESASGIEAGGRTALTSLVAGGLFILSMLFAPLFLIIPTAATSPVLVCIGISMMQGLKNVDFADAEWYPTCLMVIVSLFCGLANAIAIGMVAFIVVHLVKYIFVPSERKKENLPSIGAWVVAILSCIQFVL